MIEKQREIQNWNLVINKCKKTKIKSNRNKIPFEYETQEDEVEKNWTEGIDLGNEKKKSEIQMTEGKEIQFFLRFSSFFCWANDKIPEISQR